MSPLPPIPAFGFAAPGQILFGRGTFARAPALAATLGTHAFLVHGRTPRHAQALMRADAPATTAFACPSEPDLPLLEAALSAARAAGCDCVLAVGGGAALDLGKAVAAMLNATGSPMDHLEVVGRGQPLVAAPAPFMAVPTTAGTGAEMTKNAVIGVPQAARKVSLRDARMIARIALVDPALTDHCPRAVTLASGLDAVTQVIEPWLSVRATPLTDALCRMALPRGLAALARLMQAEDPAARDALALTSVCGGLALANAGLGAVHGLAGVIGGRAPGAPHGAVCGALIGPVLTANAQALDPATQSARRIAELGPMMSGALGTADIAAWARDAGLPGLAALGLSPADLHDTVAQAQEASSMKANPVRLDTQTLVDILRAAL